MKKLYMKPLSKGIILAGIILSGLGFLRQGLNAQDIYFTQFDYNPLVVNPANTGNFNGDWRISGNLRNQSMGNGEYRTVSLSYDRQIYILNQRFGVGLYVLNDETGASANKLVYNKIYASLAYQAMVNNSSIGIGVQFGYATGKRDDWKGYNSQTGLFDGPSGEPDLFGNSSYIDFNLGLNYKTKISFLQPEFGFSAFHLNKPDRSFYEDGKENETMAYIGSLVLTSNFNDNLYAAPKILIQNKASENATVAGIEAGFKIVGRSLVKRIFVGGYLQNGLTSDVVGYSFQAGTTVNRLDIVFNYEMTTSSQSSYGSIGAFEVSFIYKSISTVLNSYSIPCERY